MSQNGGSSVYVMKSMEIERFNIEFVSLRQELLAYAITLAGDNDLAEDLVQETLLKLWSQRERLAKHPQPKALAMSILKNQLHDEWRRKQAQPLPTADVQTVEDNTVELTDEVALIAHIVDTLPPLQRQIFKMKELEGYDQQEIMAITGCSPESLRQNLSRARRHIRQAYIRLTAAHIGQQMQNP